MNHSKYVKQFIFLIFFIGCVVFFQKTVYAESEASKNVLILHSKGKSDVFSNGVKSMNWENDIISSIDSEIIKSKKNINVSIEYMDCNSSSLDEYSRQLYNLYKYKFQNTKFDVVITLDDNAFDFAFNFILKYGNNLFPNTPVVFGGITYFDKSILNNHPLITGITKNPDVKNTIDVALKLTPNTKQVFVITNSITEDTSHKYQFNYIQLKKFGIDLKSLPEGSLVINEPEKSFSVSMRQALYFFVVILFFSGLGAIFVYLNIYKRKFAEKLLSDNENLLNTLINATPDIIYFKDHEDKFIEVNNATSKLFNINKNNFKNTQELNNIFHLSEKLFEALASNDKKAWEKGAIYRTEEVIWSEEEKTNKIYDTLRIPLFNIDGTRKGLVVLGRDITEHKLNEENEKLIKELIYYDNLKTNFFSNISHELRTPLNLIFSALQVIELKNNMSKEKDKGQEKYISIMRQNCYRLLRIISNLIDITKIDAGHFFTDFKNNDVVNIVENIVMSVVDHIENKDISITFDTEVEEKIMAFDLDAMERIILNLLSNAIKFTPSGGSIEVNIYDKINSIVISVKDTGIGIPAENQASIFKKFVQVDKSLSRNREGSGIGLSLIKELVVMHNGTIELESTLGKGSEFKIEIPVRLLPEDETSTELSTFTNNNNVEKIKIEFSDIYNL